MDTQEKGVYWRGFGNEDGTGFLILTNGEDVEIKATWDDNMVMQMSVNDLRSLTAAAHSLLKALEYKKARESAQSSQNDANP